jgi:hypothetical protein
VRNQIIGLGLQVLEARESLTGYAHTRYDTAATNTQQGLVEYAQELRDDDLHTRMPDIVKKSGWNRQFKSHDKTQKRSMTGAEAAEHDATRREQAMAREARLQGTNAYLLQGPEPIRSFLPPASTKVEMVPDTPPQRAPMAASPSLFPQIRPLPQVAFVPANLILSSQVQPNIEEEERAEEATEEAAEGGGRRRRRPSYYPRRQRQRYYQEGAEREPQQ